MKIALAALAVVCLVAGSANACYQPLNPTTTSAPNDDAAELVTILNETTSVDTFVVTLEVLVGLEPDRKGLIPVVIRNADRLGLLKGVASGKLSSEQEMVSDALEKMVEARTESKSRNTRSSSRNYIHPLPRRR